jgi:hypothetical protein
MVFTLQHEPILKKLRKLMVEPKRANLATEIDDPRANQSFTEHEFSNTTLSCTLSCLLIFQNAPSAASAVAPNTALSVTDNRLPKSTRSNTESVLPNSTTRKTLNVVLNITLPSGTKAINPSGFKFDENNRSLSSWIKALVYRLVVKISQTILPCLRNLTRGSPISGSMVTAPSNATSPFFETVTKALTD